MEKVLSQAGGPWLRYHIKKSNFFYKKIFFKSLSVGARPRFAQDSAQAGELEPFYAPELYKMAHIPGRTRERQKLGVKELGREYAAYPGKGGGLHVASVTRFGMRVSHGNVGNTGQHDRALPDNSTSGRQSETPHSKMNRNP